MKLPPKPKDYDSFATDSESSSEGGYDEDEQEPDNSGLNDIQKCSKILKKKTKEASLREETRGFKPLAKTPRAKPEPVAKMSMHDPFLP